MTDPMAERVRKIGQNALHSIGQIAAQKRIPANDAEYVATEDMLAEPRDDNHEFVKRLREVHALCDENDDVATASLLEVWIDETERRAWFLFETTATVLTPITDQTMTTARDWRTSQGRRGAPIIPIQSE